MLTYRSTLENAFVFKGALQMSRFTLLFAKVGRDNGIWLVQQTFTFGRTDVTWSVSSKLRWLNKHPKQQHERLLLYCIVASTADPPTSKHQIHSPSDTVGEVTGSETDLLLIYLQMFSFEPTCSNERQEGSSDINSMYVFLFCYKVWEPETSVLYRDLTDSLSK